ncbi:hypothetical protein [Bacillus sp. (in: firmicutes)]|uniref:hypothetical protein n=1 Tax=Bacillus sp. TaxID=1409 RepID=UPI0029041971|nr:hypothetical protein [Bacillus sp. (in: firmicutes)]MDU2394580.1 hypothetical protein [Bacillus sp. (in: firmicutes)]
MLKKLIKIALLIVILAEEIRSAKKKTILSSYYNQITVYNAKDKPVVTIDNTETPININDNYKVSLTPN